MLSKEVSQGLMEINQSGVSEEQADKAARALLKKHGVSLSIVDRQRPRSERLTEYLESLEKTKQSSEYLTPE